jgi:hypothetical protein
LDDVLCGHVYGRNVLFGKIGLPVLLFPAIDAAGATWTWWTVKK